MNPINKSYSNLSNNYVGLKNKPQVPQEPETAQVPKPSMNSTDTVAFKGVINAQAGKEAAKKAVPFLATAGAAILGFLGVSKYKKEEPVAAPKENLHDLMQARHKQMEENLAKLNNELVVIALDTPYDILSYSGVDNYICVYGYQKATVIALSRYLNGEFKAVGVCPVEAVK